METKRQVTIAIHTTSDEPYWSIKDSLSGETLHDYIDGWYGDEPGVVCEDTTWAKLRDHCASRGWAVSEARL